MFDKKYKNIMDGIKPSEESLDKARASMQMQKTKSRINIKHTLRIAVACMLALALIGGMTFAAFKISDIWNNESNQHSSGSQSKPNYNFNIGALMQANGYSEIMKVLSESKKNNIYNDFTDGVVDEVLPDIEVDFEEAPGLNDSISGDIAATDKNDFSDTNNQVSGVQEADIIKTDGEYIYYCDVIEKKLYIAKAYNGAMTKISETSLSGENIAEMILIDKTLVVISTGYDYDKQGSTFTCTAYYDLSDKSNPKKIRTMTQDGYYRDSRAIGENVYIISNYFVSKVDDLEICIPKLNGEKIAPNDILIPETVTSPQYAIITKYDVSENEDDFSSVLSVIDSASVIYCGKTDIYLLRAISDSLDNSDLVFEDKTAEKTLTTNTNIHKISLDGKELSYFGTGIVPGIVNDQFSIDEKDGCLRVATNINYSTVLLEDTFITGIDGEEYNKVFCLDEGMQIIGESDKLGIDESIKSVRYIGDIAYVVTFRQTDPLYAVDLSDPTNPKTLSALKIDGFSTYMHPYGDGKLLGIGYDADANTGGTRGLKLTMFDISDNSAVSEISTYVMPWGNNSYINSSATYNHKATLIDAKKGIIALPINSEYFLRDGDGEFEYPHFKREFVFFEFDGNTLSEKGRVVIDEFSDHFDDAEDLEKEYAKFFNDESRSIYIGDYGYIVSSNGIISISLETIGVVSELKF